MRIKLGVLALLVLTAACTGSSPGAPTSARKVFHIGLFHVGLNHVPGSVAGLAEGLEDLGYLTKKQVETFKQDLVSLPVALALEGKKVQLDWRNLADEAAANETAKEFVRQKKDLVVAFEDQTIRAAKAATTTIPTVFVHATNPVAEGYVASISHPGGNLTGVVGFPVLTQKQLEMFDNVLPSLQRVLILTDPTDPAAPKFVDQARAAAAARKLTLVERRVTDEKGIERVFEGLHRGEVDGVLIASQALQTKFSELVTGLTREHRLPFMVADRARVEKGGLLSYGPNFKVVGRTAARYVNEILQGAHPADLPVQTPELELVINLKVAHGFGLELEPSWLDRADDVVSG